MKLKTIMKLRKNKITLLITKLVVQKNLLMKYLKQKRCLKHNQHIQLTMKNFRLLQPKMNTITLKI